MNLKVKTYAEAVEATENKNEYDITKCFDNIKPLVWSEDNINKIASKMREVIEYYEYDHDGYHYRHYRADYAENLVKKCSESKGWIDRMFSCHPNYIPEKHMIVLTGEYCREVDRNKIYRFFEWVKEMVDDMFEEKSKANLKKEVEWVNPFTGEVIYYTYGELDEFCNKLSKIGYPNTVDALSNYTHKADCTTIIKEVTEIKNFRDETVQLFDGSDIAFSCIKAMADIEKGYNEFLNLRATYKTVLKSIKEAIEKSGVKKAYGYNISSAFVLSKEEEKELSRIRDFIYIMENYAEQKVSAKLASNINESWYEEIRAVEGQKTTKIIGKFAKAIGLDKIKDIRLVTEYDNSGTPHERQRDFGWNRKYAEYCDAINPLKVKQWTCISVNPIDYIRMSMGKGWASCHTIDKINKDDRSSTYEGCYSAGTLSYMLDDCTVEMYVVSENYRGNDYELQDKIHRCNFHLGHGKIVQGRVYPDGRDSSSFPNISTEMREIFCRVISECLNIPNYWTINKGVSACMEIAYKDEDALNYPDWENYNDCVAIRVGSTETKINHEPIVIGATAKCVCCGDDLYEADYIMCEDCRNVCRCSYCGDLIYTEREDYICIERDYEGVYYYCCERCAERDGWVKMYDKTWAYKNDDIFYDAYYGNYYYCDDNDVIIAKDGNYFADYESAKNADYVYVKSHDEWYNVRKCEFCEECEQYVLISEFDYDTGMCMNCAKYAENEE